MNGVAPARRTSGANGSPIVEGAPDAGEALRQIEALIADLGRGADPRALADARALVRAVLDLHGAGLARIVELARGSASPPASPGGPSSLLEALAADDAVAALLLLHGLHPVGIDVRVRAALKRASPVGWTSELLDAGGGILRVAIRRVGDPKRVATSDRVRALIEQAIEAAAPDAEGLEFSGDLDDDAAADFIPLERLRSPGPAAGDRAR